MNKQHAICTQTLRNNSVLSIMQGIKWHFELHTVYMKPIKSGSWEIPVPGTVSQYFRGAENKSGHKSLILC